MKSQKKVTKFVLLAIVFLALAGTLLAAPGVTYDGTTTVTFSANPATLSGDSTPDVTITTTTVTTLPEGEPYIDDGKVQIYLATDGFGNPVSSSTVDAIWVKLNVNDGETPINGVTTLDVDLDALGFTCETVGGFKAHYVTGGGQNKVGTHWSEPVDLTIECGECEWIGETAWANDDPYNADDQGNWATYTPYVADSTVILYAGQDMEAGTVHFSAVDSGNVTITITLNEGWRFNDIDENVKIQDYEAAPSGNPSPGLFDSKDYAFESPFSIDVPANNFYGVHVDVEWEYCD